MAEFAQVIFRAEQALTPRERAILSDVTKGHLSKQTTGDFGLTEATVKMHRSNMMRKSKAKSIAELCLMADKLNL